MRILPHTWDGLHPAFPLNPDPSESSLSLKPPITIMASYPLPSCGALALLCVAVSAKPTMSRTTRRSLGALAKTTLLATTMGVANTVNVEIAERHAASVFLRCRHIELPAFAVADRLTSWDADNWSVLGGVAGLFVARRRACTIPSVSRPLCYLLHAMSGACLAGFGLVAQKVTTRGWHSVSMAAMRDKQIADLQKASYQPEVAREMVLDALSSMGVLAVLREVQIGKIKLSPELVDALKEITTPRLVRPRSGSRSQTAVEQILSASNHSDGFHKTHRLPGTFEPVPYSERNYDWSCEPQQHKAIPELEKHIVELRKQRQ
jgi:hypothetical protein